MKKNYFLVLMIIMMLFTACAKTPEAYIEKAEKVEKQEPDKAIEY